MGQVELTGVLLAGVLGFSFKAVLVKLERISALQVLGAVAVLFGVLLVSWRRSVPVAED